MRQETQKRTFAGKALNVALAVVLAVGLMPPVHAFGEEASGGGRSSEQLTAGQDAPAGEEAQGPVAGEDSLAAEEEQAQVESPDTPAANDGDAEGADPAEEEQAQVESPDTPAANDGDAEGADPTEEGAADKAESADKNDPVTEDPAAKKDAADKGKTTPMPAFKDVVEVDGVKITVSAGEGAFLAGCKLKATAVPVDKEYTSEGNVALSYAFDIEVLDKDGKPVQPADGKKVSVQFESAKVADANLDTRVYHTDAEGTEELPVTTDGAVASAVSDGFSVYTVEFTYGKLTYAMEGGATVPMADVLAHVGLEGEPSAVKVSNPELFSAADENGQWTLTAHQPFTSDEWMKVAIDGVEYEITVTDALAAGSAHMQAQGGEGNPVKLASATGTSDGVVYQMAKAHIHDKSGVYIDGQIGRKLIFIAGGTKAEYLSHLPSNAAILEVGVKHGDSDEYKDKAGDALACYVDVIRATAGFDSCPHGTLQHTDLSEYNCWWGGVEGLQGATYYDVEYPYGSKVQVTLAMDNAPWSDARVALYQGSSKLREVASGANGVYDLGYWRNGSYDIYVDGVKAGSVTVNAKPKNAEAPAPGEPNSDGFAYVTDQVFGPTLSFSSSGDDTLNATYQKVQVTLAADQLMDGSQVTLRDAEGNVQRVLACTSTSGTDAVFTGNMKQEGASYKVYVDGQYVYQDVSTAASGTHEATVTFYTAKATVTKDGAAWADLPLTLDNGRSRYALQHGEGGVYTANVLAGSDYALAATGVVDPTANTISATNKAVNLDYYTVSYYTYQKNGDDTYTQVENPARTQVVRGGCTTAAASDVYVQGLMFRWYSAEQWASGEDPKAQFDFANTPIDKKTDLYAQFAKPGLEVDEFIRTDENGNLDGSGQYFRLGNLTITGYDEGASAILSAAITATNCSQIKVLNTNGYTVKDSGGTTLANNGTTTKGGITVRFGSGVSMAEAQAWLRANLVFTPMQGKECTVEVSVSDKDLAEAKPDTNNQSQVAGNMTRLTNSMNDLASGNYYVDGTVSYVGAAGQAGLRIKSGAKVYIYVASGASLTAKGGAGAGGSSGSVGNDGGASGGAGGAGGGAGIWVPSTSELCLDGPGAVAATGGNAGSGGTGGNGAASGLLQTAQGYGGGGGGGGGGAGAGIGTNGGAGGAGGKGGYRSYDGGNGAGGSPASASGKIYILNSANKSSSGGAGGSKGADGSDATKYTATGYRGRGGLGGGSGAAYGLGGGGGGGGGGGKSHWVASDNGSSGSNGAGGSGSTTPGSGGFSTVSTTVKFGDNAAIPYTLGTAKTITVPDAPSVSGKSFLGWQVTKYGKFAGTGSTHPLTTAETTYYQPGNEITLAAGTYGDIMLTAIYQAIPGVVSTDDGNMTFSAGMPDTAYQIYAIQTTLDGTNTDMGPLTLTQGSATRTLTADATGKYEMTLSSGGAWTVASEKYPGAGKATVSPGTTNVAFETLAVNVEGRTPASVTLKAQGGSTASPALVEAADDDAAKSTWTALRMAGTEPGSFDVYVDGEKATAFKDDAVSAAAWGASNAVTVSYHTVSATIDGNESATSVELRPANGSPIALTKGSDGKWTATRAREAGAYTLYVNGVAITNQTTSFAADDALSAALYRLTVNTRVDDAAADVGDVTIGGKAAQATATGTYQVVTTDISEEARTAKVKTGSAELSVGTVKGSETYDLTADFYSVRYKNGTQEIATKDGGIHRAGDLITAQSQDGAQPTEPFDTRTCDFAGWSDGTTTYKATGMAGGPGTFTMPAQAVTLTSAWTQKDNVAGDAHEATVTAVETVYNAVQQVLASVDASTLEHGRMVYAIGGDGDEPPAAATFTENVPQETAAGVYRVWYRVLGADETDGTQTVLYGNGALKYVDSTITKAPIEPTVEIEGWTYGDAPNEPAVVRDPIGKDDPNCNGAVTCYYKAADADDSAYSTDVPTQAGDYLVKASVAECDNYKAGETAQPAAFTIARKPITDAAAGSVVYDATEKAFSMVDVKSAGEVLVSGRDYEIDADESTLSATNADGYTVKIDGKGNYTDSATVTWSIERRPATVTALAQTVKLGGEIATGTGMASLAGAVSGHSLSGVTLAGDTATATPNGAIVPSAAAIADGDGADVTGNYNITYANGRLVVQGKVHYVLQNADGSWPASADSAESATRPGDGSTFAISKRFDHYSAGGYSAAYLPTGGSTTEDLASIAGFKVAHQDETIHVEDGVNDLYVYYFVDTYNLRFYSDIAGQTVWKSVKVGYGRDLSGFAPAVDDSGNWTGTYQLSGDNSWQYTFGGWATEPGITVWSQKGTDSLAEAFDFSQMMPDHDVNVYPVWVANGVYVRLDMGAYDAVAAQWNTNFYDASRYDPNTPASMGSDNYDDRYNTNPEHRYQGRQFWKSTTSTDRVDMGVMNIAKRTGFTLDGWYTSSGMKWESSYLISREYGDKNADGSPVLIYEAPYRNNTYVITLTANWNLNKATIAYDAGGGSAAPTDATEYQVGGAITVGAAPTAPTSAESGKHYVFAGWKDKKGGLHAPGETIVYADDSLVTAYGETNVIGLAAEYQLVADGSLVFDSQGGSLIKPVAGGATIDLTGDQYKPTRAGYTFGGWYVEPGCTTAIPSPVTVPTEGKTIYAKWTPNQVTLSFNSRGGTTVAEITESYGADVTAPANPTREGYTFLGWDKAIPSKMPASDMTFNALWTVKSHALSYNTDGGSAIDPETRNYGDFVAEPAAPTREGYTFIRWLKYVGSDTEGAEVSFPFTMPDSDVTLKAVWKQSQAAPAAPPATAGVTRVSLTSPQGDEEYILVPRGHTPTDEDWTAAKKLEPGMTEVDFDGLVPNTAYDAYARRFETVERAASPASPKTEVTTLRSNQNPLPAPPVQPLSPTSVVVDPTQDGAEYIIVPKGKPIPEDGDWKEPDEDGKVVFDDLEPGTEYDIYVRKKGTERQYPSEPSPATRAKTLDMTPPTPVEGLVYDGEAHELVVAGSAEGGTMLYSLDGEVWSEGLPSGTAAGDYDVWYKVKGDPGYDDTEPAKLVVSIAKAAPPQGELPDAQKPQPAPGPDPEPGTDPAPGPVYTGKPQPLVTPPTELPQGYEKVQYSLDDGETWTDEVPTGTDAGDYEVKVKYVGDPNHEDFVPEKPVKVAIGEVDKDELAEAIEEAEAFHERIKGDYPDEAQALKDAIDAARAVAGDKNVTAEQVAAALQALQQARETIGAQVVSYFCLKGAGGEWTKGSTGPLTFTFKRSIDDELTYGLFVGAKVDGADVPESAYAKAEGSLVLSLTATYLETLSVGEHTLTAVFDDGEGEAKFSVAAPSYVCIKGGDSTWTKGGKDGLELAFKRVVEFEEADTTFAHFVSASVDGKELVKGKDYTAVEGSVVLTLSPAFLEALADGGHTLTATFDDGEGEAKFLVAAPTKAASSKSTSAKTGDTMPFALLAVSAMLSLAVLLVSRMRVRKPVRGKHGR